MIWYKRNCATHSRPLWKLEIIYKITQSMYEEFIRINAKRFVARTLTSTYWIPSYYGLPTLNVDSYCGVNS